MKIPIPILISLAALFCGCTEHESSDLDTSARRATIEAITVQMKEELVLWHSEGVDDGNGLLYQSTPSYQELRDLCTKDDLLAIHKEIAPAAPFN